MTGGVVSPMVASAESREYAITSYVASGELKKFTDMIPTWSFRNGSYQEFKARLRKLELMFDTLSIGYCLTHPRPTAEKVKEMYPDMQSPVDQLLRLNEMQDEYNKALTAVYWLCRLTIDGERVADLLHLAPW